MLKYFPDFIAFSRTKYVDPSSKQLKHFDQKNKSKH